MPSDFDKCIREKGKVIRVKPNEKTYLNICYDQNNKAHSGKIHHMKEEAEAEITALLEESSTANIAANPTTAMSKVMRKVMPKGSNLTAKDMKDMTTTMKDVMKSGKLAAATLKKKKKKKNEKAK